MLPVLQQTSSGALSSTQFNAAVLFYVYIMVLGQNWSIRSARLDLFELIH